MLLSEMETTTWNQALASTGKAQARLNDTTITISDGYQGELPGTFVTGEVALVIQKHSGHSYYERMTYLKMDERTRDRLAQDILSTLKRKERLEANDLDLDFQPVDNRLPA